MEANTAGLHLTPPSRGCHHQQHNGAHHVQDQHVNHPRNAAAVLLCTGYADGDVAVSLEKWASAVR